MQGSLFREPGSIGTLDLGTLRARAQACTRCVLHEGRKNVVFGVGSKTPQLAFVGEAPGAREDDQGVPFVGPSGKLLGKMIRAMGLSRGDVYICNTVCCRPPGNRTPSVQEQEACHPILLGQLDAVRPPVLVALGGAAAQALLGTNQSISKLREEWHTWEGLPLRVTYHPAYLLRYTPAKRDTWEDLQAVMRCLGLHTWR